MFAKCPITVVLIVINCLVYALEFLIPHDWVFYQGAYNPALVEATGQWYRALSSGFIHDPDNIGHLLMNMLTLFLFGQAIEPLIKGWKYITIYLLSILGGSALISIVVHQTGQLDTTTIGASGGIFGLFGVFFALAKLQGQQTLPIIILVAVNFFYGFFIGNVSWEAHLGGLMTGIILGFLLLGRGSRSQGKIGPSIEYLAKD